MTKLVIASILLLSSVSSIASAKTLHMRALTVTASPKATMTQVSRSFASAHYSAPCEWFTRLDGTSVKICDGSVKAISDGVITRAVVN